MAYWYGAALSDFRVRSASSFSRESMSLKTRCRSNSQFPSSICRSYSLRPVRVRSTQTSFFWGIEHAPTTRLTNMARRIEVVERTTRFELDAFICTPKSVQPSHASTVARRVGTALAAYSSGLREPFVRSLKAPWLTGRTEVRGSLGRVSSGPLRVLELASIRRPLAAK